MTALRMAAEAVEVPMELIKKLRGMSGAPIMDCKRALAEEKLGRAWKEGWMEGGREGGKGEEGCMLLLESRNLGP